MACGWTSESFMLMARAVGWLLAPTDEWRVFADAPAEARAWLPSPQALLALAAAERAWDVYLCGAQHPALACALVYGRLGRWAEAKEVAAGLLECLLQPLSRFEARRLLARCWAHSAAMIGSAASGEVEGEVVGEAEGEERGEAAREAAREAASEAAAAGYEWLSSIAA